jgi:uncharacterized lipoprotein YddW (UPF0748 family)
MRLAGVRATLSRGLTVVVALVLLGLSPSPSPRVGVFENTPSETRALWVLRTSLASPASIATLTETARAHGFNTLLVQVRGRGDAYFNGGVEPRAADLQRQPATFDPLATVLAAADAAGLRVHAWVNVNLISSAADLPINSAHIVHRHPDWLMVPRELAQELARVKEESPAYVGKLARWTRASSDEIEGLYASPVIPGAVAHVDAVVRDLVSRYNVDGVHLDYARYPSDRFDYSVGAIREFRETIRPRLTAAVRRDLDAQESEDLFAYPDRFPEGWKTFRTSRMTALVARLRQTIKAARPATLVTVATAPDLQEARDRRLQDWAAWLQDGLIDAVCPMAYTPEPARFAEQIAAARDVAGNRLVWAGIGAYRLPPSQTIEHIETARRLGAHGVVLFSYDSLVDPRQSAPDYIAVVGRSAFARPAATSGTR